MGDAPVFDPEAMPPEGWQAILDSPPVVAVPTHQRMLAAIGVAFSDALGPHGEQPELRSRWERGDIDRGRRLQVSGHIDLLTLQRKVATQVLDIMLGYSTRTLLQVLPPETVTTMVQALAIPGESFDDL